MTSMAYRPSDAYNRLLSGFGLEQTPDNSRTYFTVLSELLSVSHAQLSDCIRRGTVTDTVLEAAKAKGIHPDYITKGIQPAE